MKRRVLFIFLLIICLSFNSVKAACHNEELNDWATKVEVKFVETTKINAQSLGYAYFLTIAPLREDIKVKVTDVSGNSAYAKKYDYIYYKNNADGLPEQVEDSIYGVGCYNNLENETYKIEVYGGDSSACKNELLKTLTYTVPRYNRLFKSQLCEKYPDHELCNPYTDKTKNMSEAEFNKKMQEYDEEISGNVEKERSLIIKILIYSLYMIIPFVIVTVIYMTKIKKYKKSERRK